MKTLRKENLWWRQNSEELRNKMIEPSPMTVSEAAEMKIMEERAKLKESGQEMSQEAIDRENALIDKLMDF